MIQLARVFALRDRRKDNGPESVKRAGTSLQMFPPAALFRFRLALFTQRTPAVPAHASTWWGTNRISSIWDSIWRYSASVSGVNCTSLA